MQPILFNLDSDPLLAEQIAQQLSAEIGELDTRSFPDGESYLRVLSDCEARSVIIFCNLFQPNNKILRLIFLSNILKELGVKRIGLVTPYLPYMRQDKQFKSGECVTSRPFAKLLSDHLDWLVTLDPHLHRYHSLTEIYDIESRVVHAAPVISSWVQEHIKQPLLIGPDSESEQWVSEVAKLAGVPFQVLSKIRHGDYHVEVSLPEVDQWKEHTPVLLDDIISSGKTMLETVQHLKELGLPKPLCIGVHGLFANNSYDELLLRADVVTCNSIPHPSNSIDISRHLTTAIRELIQ
ncbi:MULTISPECIES: ribose-phosphate pyrophosphokinase [unclassified Neptuniibacter]|uniref:ribose-phosphate pyrophosphokinase n=1 Tax=unclassified Neptuniibacter TaxID=2630693 RepID=UPI000C689BAD|nr:MULTISPECIES: ribose-phosphate pyrophosphokinase [unclassified Neptuniibacter]MAY41129.1 phosphoribosylpyrophosphate synthetase [Oceanospirillaceae bacterium]|tara:strand:+ start:7057 stop:7938 length:882 start_codon:yes stop_codon:yes gene_type:complete